MMEKITLLVNVTKNFDSSILKSKLEELAASDQTEVLLIQYHNKIKNAAGFPAFSIEEHEDVSFSQILSSITTKRFMFFDPDINYPEDFFIRIFSPVEKASERVRGGAWTESIIAVQQSHYGLCQQHSVITEDFAFLNSSVLFNKEEVQSLNTDRLSVHPESAMEIYRYAVKKKLSLLKYSPLKKKQEYLTHFRELMALCQRTAQNEFKLFPAFFVLFFLIFGVGAAYHPLIALIFLIGMSVYLLAITMEAFGLSSIKQNGGLVPVLLFLFPFIHLVYGLESWMAKFKKKV